ADTRRALPTWIPRTIALLAVALFFAGAAAAAPAPAPRLRSLLKAARVVASGQVAAVTEYDDGRVAVLDFAVDQVLKGKPAGAPPLLLAMVELREGPQRPAVQVGQRAIVFLQPAPRTSYLGRRLPAGTYYQLVPEFGALLEADSPAAAARQTAIVNRVLESARGAGLGAGARQLTFDLLAEQNPILVEEAIPGVAGLGPQPVLTDAELATLRGALQRADLPLRVRVSLVAAVGSGDVKAAVPTLQGLTAPPEVVEAAWQALNALGAAPPEASLDEQLAGRDPKLRAAAARELLRRDGVDAVSRVAPIALQDPDETVRIATVEALGALGKPEVLPPLERSFSESGAAANGTTLQQTTGRAILAVGGQPAAEAFGRLAFVGPPDSQYYAVVLLMTMDAPQKDAVLARVAATHQDERIQHLLKDGLNFHDH
ncbi:MAG: HEAT repeat domain-containing protein, partial [Candidatus Binatia bacterium]